MADTFRNMFDLEVYGQSELYIDTGNIEHSRLVHTTPTFSMRDQSERGLVSVLDTGLETFCQCDTSFYVTK